MHASCDGHAMPVFEDISRELKRDLLVLGVSIIKIDSSGNASRIDPLDFYQRQPEAGKEEKEK